jgi:hypothetical protein
MGDLLNPRWLSETETTDMGIFITGNHLTTYDLRLTTYDLLYDYFHVAIS